MNITLTPQRQVALERAAREKSTTEKPLSAEALIELLLNGACDSYAATQQDLDNLAMASNERLMALGAAVMARPDKFEEVERAAKAILDIP